MTRTAAPSGLRGAVRTLTPGYFALVMASGIISVGMRQHGRLGLSVFLLGVCAVSFAVLIALNVWRIVAFRDEVVSDFTDPARGFGFFMFKEDFGLVPAALATVDGADWDAMDDWAQTEGPAQPTPTEAT